MIPAEKRTVSEGPAASPPIKQVAASRNEKNEGKSMGVHQEIVGNRARQLPTKKVRA